MKPIRLWGVTVMSHGRRTLLRHHDRSPVLFSSRAKLLRKLEMGGSDARAKFDPKPIRLKLSIVQEK